MKLNADGIMKIAHGVVYVSEENDGIHLNRFTKEQENIYSASERERRIMCTAGVSLEFETDSTSLYIKTETSPGCSYRGFSHEIYCNGKLLGEITNKGLKDNPLGIYDGHFELGSGNKSVKVLFPWSVVSVIKEFVIDDGAYIKPVKYDKTMIMFGDSITHGAYASVPSAAYSAKIARALGAEAINKGIGGDIFRSELGAAKDNFVPDYITVAYGTNNWTETNPESFEKNCEGFFGNLVSNYPDTKIFAITPIRRRDTAQSKFASFECIADFIIKTVEKYNNIIPVNGFSFLPDDENYFFDSTVHPNDKGFELYFQGLIKEIQKYI